MQLVKVLYCKLLAYGMELPALSYQIRLRANFTKVLSQDFDLKLRVLSLILAKSVVLHSERFTKLRSLSFR